MKYIKTLAASLLAALTFLPIAAWSATVEESAKAVQVDFHLKNATILEAIDKIKAAAKEQGVKFKIGYASPPSNEWRDTRITMDLKKSNLWDAAKLVAALSNSVFKVISDEIVIDGTTQPS